MGASKTAAEVSTRDRLIQAVLDLAKDQPIDEVPLDQVLRESGASSGSVYHFFEDYGHLIETAMARRYLEIVELGAVLLETLLDEATDLEDLERRLGEGIAAYARRNTPAVRYERARIVARAEKSERLREILGQEQQELTDALMVMLRKAQRPRGWLDPNLDPKAMAVMVQAASFGRLIDDFTPDPMEQEKWLELYRAFFMRTFVGNPDSD